MIQEYALSSRSAIALISRVLTPADADARHSEARQTVLPTTADAEKGGDAECRTLGMASTGGDSDLTDAARRLRAEV